VEPERLLCAGRAGELRGVRVEPWMAAGSPFSAAEAAGRALISSHERPELLHSGVDLVSLLVYETRCHIPW